LKLENGQEHGLSVTWFFSSKPSGIILE